MPFSFTFVGDVAGAYLQPTRGGKLLFSTRQFYTGVERLAGFGFAGCANNTSGFNFSR